MEVTNHRPADERPSECAVAFKEWAAVCLALGAGEQLLILRKGGIHEGRAGFQVAHRWFWLYPTRFHESPGQLTPTASQWLAPARDLAPPSGRTWLRHLAEVTDVYAIPTLTGLARLEGWHGWSTETVQSRFAYRQPGLFALVVRIYRRDEPWDLAETAAMAGCRSWVELDGPLTTAGVKPVLADPIFLSRRQALCAVLREACGQ